MKPVAAHAADLPQLIWLEECFPAGQRWSKDAWAEELTGPDRLTLVVRDGTRLLGVITLHDLGEMVDLNRIIVAPQARRTGVADALMAAAAHVVPKRCLLEVRDDNAPAIALYRKHGFATIHRREGYYGAGTDALVMERNQKA